MADDRARAALRASADDPLERARWLTERLRAGELAAERLALAAYLGDPAAELACPPAARLPARVHGTLRWWLVDVCGAAGSTGPTRAALALADCEQEGWVREHAAVCEQTCGPRRGGLGSYGPCLGGLVRVGLAQVRMWVDVAEAEDWEMAAAKLHSARWRSDQVASRAPLLRWAYLPALCASVVHARGHLARSDCAAMVARSDAAMVFDAASSIMHARGWREAVYDAGMLSEAAAAAAAREDMRAAREAEAPLRAAVRDALVPWALGEPVRYPSA